MAALSQHLATLSGADSTTMIRLHINPAFKAQLEHSGLTGYDDFMATSAGNLVTVERRRDVRKLELEALRCYLKRSRLEKAHSALESYLSGTLAHSKPYKEMLQIRHLQRCGFSAVEVIAAGERLRWGVPVEGFILTLEAPGQELSRCYSESNAKNKTALLGHLGSLVARLHRYGFFLSVRLNDVFVQSNAEGSEPTLTLIDREARNPAPRKFSVGRAKHGLYSSWRRQVRAGDRIAPASRKAFLKAYCTEVKAVWTVRPCALLRELRKMADKEIARLYVSARKAQQVKPDINSNR